MPMSAEERGQTQHLTMSHPTWDARTAGMADAQASVPEARMVSGDLLVTSPGGAAHTHGTPQHVRTLGSPPPVTSPSKINGHSALRPDRWRVFSERLRAFNRVGRRTEVVRRDGLDYFVNDYWTARQRQSNRIHEISYRACFKPELPEFFIRHLTDVGDSVFDPFMGRGTTVIQSALMGRVPLGNDINPLCAFLASPRLDPPTFDEVDRRLGVIPRSSETPHDEDLLAFYHPKTLDRVLDLRYWLGRDPGSDLGKVDAWIRMVALNRLSGHSPGFFSVYTMPPNQAVSARKQRQINAKRNQVPPPRNVDEIILRKTKALLSQNPPGCPATVGTHPSTSAPNVPDETIDLIVTSPPFLDVVDYAGDNWLRLWFAGIDPGDVAVSVHRSPEDWVRFVTDSFIEFHRVLKRGGFVAFEVGEVRRGSVLLELLVEKALRALPFDICGVVVHDQKFTKTANCWGVSNNSRGTNSNRIVVIRKR